MGQSGFVKTGLGLLIVATFLAAYVSFQIQPLAARWMLPRFGGSAGVWSASMLFFQCGLLLGYAYTYLLTKFAGLRAQLLTHCALLTAAVPLLPWGLPNFSTHMLQGAPSAAVLLSLLAAVGIPYVLLTATAPLLQAWGYAFRATDKPYRLYVYSNTGSLLGLLAYPFFIEANLALPDQFFMWSALFCVLVALFLILGLGFQEAITHPSVSDEPTQAETMEGKRRSIFVYLYWWFLSALGVALLLATTNFLSQDVAVTPFTWVLPFSLYLLSFMVTFDSPRWYRRVFWLPVAVLACVIASNYFISHYRSGMGDISDQLVILLSALFAGCMVFHGELHRSKPAPIHLPVFYLCLALGGASGGMFANFLAPTIFSDLWELPLMLMAVVVFISIISVRHSNAHAGLGASVFSVVSTVTVLVIFSAVFSLIREEQDELIAAQRGFYGVLKVREKDVGQPSHRKTLYYGQINHGSEFLNKAFQSAPGSYYDVGSGVGVVLSGGVNPLTEQDLVTYPPRNIGVVGLGTGALTYYQRPNDHFTFFELNPQVVELARQEFSTLGSVDSNVSVVLGDGRLSLADRSTSGGRQFDVLIIDAFSGDSIPVHLLTKEAFEIYRSRLNPNGVLAVHISNRYFHLQPLMYGLAEALSWDAALVRRPRGPNGYIKRSTWVLMGDNPELFGQRKQWTYYEEWSSEDIENSLVWTDNYIDIFPLLD